MKAIKGSEIIWKITITEEKKMFPICRAGYLGEDPSWRRLEVGDDKRAGLSRFLLVRKDGPGMNESNQKAISMRYNELPGKKHKGFGMICHWCLDGED